MPNVYTFAVGDQTHELPPPEDAVKTMPGRVLRDAAVDGEEGQLRLGFLMLEASGAEQSAVDALYDLPAAEMMERIQEWMTFKPSEEDVSVGESSGSSV